MFGCVCFFVCEIASVAKKTENEKQPKKKTINKIEFFYLRVVFMTLLKKSY